MSDGIGKNPLTNISKVYLDKIAIPEAKVDKLKPEHERATARDKRYDNPSGALKLGGGVRTARRADHRDRDELNKDAKDIRRGRLDRPQFQGKTGKERIAAVKKAKGIVEGKQNDSYLETDMKKRQKNNEKARKDMKKMGSMSNPHFGDGPTGSMSSEEVEVDEAMSSYDRNRKRAAQRAADRNAARAAGKTGVVPGVGYVSPRKERETYVDSAGTTRHKSGAKMPKD